MGRRYVVPDRSRPMFDYRRPCDRCSWAGWLRSELHKEPQTGLIVCEPCLDKPREDLERNNVIIDESRKILD